jgi:hypothetical protein
MKIEVSGESIGLYTYYFLLGVMVFLVLLMMSFGLIVMTALNELAGQHAFIRLLTVLVPVATGFSLGMQLYRFDSLITTGPHIPDSEDVDE